MDWEKIVQQIPTVIERVRTDYVLNNMIIKDDIFGILEKHCTVIYYPIENEINCGFHTKRFEKKAWWFLVWFKDKLKALPLFLQCADRIIRY